MDTYDEINEKLNANFDLLCNIISEPSIDTDIRFDLKKDLLELENIINNEIPDTLKDYAPEDFYDLYLDFKREYGRFKDFILYDKLIGKNVVALGGVFSSGKSSFLNALSGERALPAAEKPSTSVPTYIVYGDKHEVMGINVFDSKVIMNVKDIRKIAHGFGELYDDNDDRIKESITLGHILETLFLSTPKHKYKNLAFVDTPGYSKANDNNYTVKTDEKIARSQLNSSNYILWFVGADNKGGMSEDDLKFIKSLRPEIPKLIILNKADMKDYDELQLIIENTKRVLDLKGIKYIDVLTFSNKMEYIEEDDLYTLISNDTSKIVNQLNEWNNETIKYNFAKNFKVLFMKCKKFYEQKIDEESRKLMRLNTSITRIKFENFEQEIIEPLQSMVTEAKYNLDKLKSINNTLKNLQESFFTKIKLISDEVSIDMPAPSEIDLIKEEANNPLDLLNEYKKKNGIKTDYSLVIHLKDIFNGIEPVLDIKQGGLKHKQELINELRSNLVIEDKKSNLINIFNEELKSLEKNRKE